MDKSRKWLKKAGILAMAIVLCLQSVTVYAAPDWNQIAAVETGSAYSNLQKIQSAYDESNLYIHITGGISNTYDPLPQLQILVNQQELEGNMSRLVLVCDTMQEGENVLTVKNSWWQDTQVQGTLIRTEGINEMDITIPFSVIGVEAMDISEIAVNALVNDKKEAECPAISLIPQGGEPENPAEPEEPENPAKPEKPAEPEEPDQPEEPEIPVQPEGIILDGIFSDWEKYELAYGGRNGIGKVSLTSDGTDVYIRIVEDGSFDHSFPQGGAPIGLTSNMGKILWLNARMKNTGEKIELSFSGLEMAQGIGAKTEDVFNWEIKIPLSEVWQEITAVSELSLIWPEDRTVVMTAANPSYSEPGGSGGDLVVGGGLLIDGYYEDWNNIPHTEITYEGNNKTNNHTGALFMGEEYIFGHYKMNRLYTSYIQVHSMQIQINGTQYMLQMLPIDAQGNIDWSASNQKLQNGIYTNFAVYLSGVPGSSSHYNKVGQGAMTIYDSSHSESTPGDEVEFSISFQRLEELTGLKPAEIREIKLYNPNIGHEWLTCVGTSTAPLVGILLSVFAAAGLYCIWNRGNKKKEGSNP